MKRISIFLTVAVWLVLGLVAAQGQLYQESLSGSDQVVATTSFQHALENNQSGTATNWHNPDTDHSGTTLPIKTFQTADGVYCREFQQANIIGDRPQQGYGTACRQSDGSWQFIDPAVVHQPGQNAVTVTPRHLYDYAPRYAYPRWFYPSHPSFSFGHLSHRSHFFSGHRNFRRHNNLHQRRSHQRGHRMNHHRGHGGGHRRSHR